MNIRLTGPRTKNNDFIIAGELVESTAVNEGYGLCYDSDDLTLETAATTAAGVRGNTVKHPAIATAREFAGVAIQDYDADTRGNQEVRFFAPGSVCLISADAAVTINDILTCDVGDKAGQWIAGGRGGRGSARALQTTSAAGLVLAKLLDGDETGLAELRESLPNGAIAGGLSPVGHSKLDATGATADVTDTLADGLVDGEIKSYEAVVVPTGAGQDFVITVTSGIVEGATTAFTTATFTANGQVLVLRWENANWKVIYNSGATIA